MPKSPMRVIPRPAKYTRYVRTAQGAGSSVMGSGTEGDYTYLCGNWLDTQLLHRAAEAGPADV